MDSWMRDLSDDVRRKPITRLSIPGSHNSFTYALNCKWKLAVDQNGWLRRIDCLWVRKVVLRWAKCQQLDVTEQLVNGIRFFDLRVATRGSSSTDDDDLYLVHGLYGGKVADALRQISAFLKTHFKEVVFLDINHFYDFSREDHARLLTLIATTFAAMLCPSHGKLRLDDVTLDTCLKNRWQVVVFYQCDELKSLDTRHLTWPSRFIKSPWANTDSVDRLFWFCEQQLQQRQDLLPDGGVFVVQSILTPKTRDFVLHWRSSLRRRLAEKTTQRTTAWLKERQRSARPVDCVVLADFVDLFEFCRSVVDANFE